MRISTAIIIGALGVSGAALAQSTPQTTPQQAPPNSPAPTTKPETTDPMNTNTTLADPMTNNNTAMPDNMTTTDNSTAPETPHKKPKPR